MCLLAVLLIYSIQGPATSQEVLWWQRHIQEYTVNPDEAVAYGAAIQGSILSREEGTEDIIFVIVLLQVQASTLCHIQAPSPP